MISLQKIDNVIKFTFQNNDHYLQNGTIEVPVNSLSLVTDESEMFTFKKSATNDVFVSGLYSEIGMTKAELETFYKENMVGSTGGGTDSGMVQTMIDESISGKADTSAVTASIEAAVSGKQDTLSAGTGIDITNNVISATGGGGGEGTVSGYTYKSENFSYEYSDAFEGPVYIKYDGYSGDSGNLWAGNIIIANSEWDNISNNITLVLEDGVITGAAYYGQHLNVSVENGIAAVTSDSGYYILFYVPKNDFVGYIEKVYSSGNTSDVIENTVYDMFDKLKGEISNMNITDAFVSLIDGQLSLGLVKGTGGKRFGGSVTLASPTINTEGEKLNTQFATPEASQKTLNTGQWGMCDVGGDYYDSSYDDMTITFNSGYTGGSTSEIMYLRFIHSGGSDTNENIITYNVTANTISYDAFLSNYCTITDTVSTDYKIKITPNTGYRIRRFINNNCSIAGVDAEDKSGYVIVLITSTSYIQDGQAVIDDIYDRFDEVEQVTSRALNELNNNFGGLKLVRTTQDAYDAITTKDENTIYIIKD